MKHPSVKGCYTTLDKQYLIYKADTGWWHYGTFIPKEQKFMSDTSFKYRTLTDCKYAVAEQMELAKGEEELWQK